MEIKQSLLFFMLLCIFCEVADAQEIQIPVDQNGRIEQIDRGLEQKLNLFPEYSNFIEARLFRISDTLFVLEIYSRPEDRIFKKRTLLSGEEVEVFRQKVTDAISREPLTVRLDQSGRNRLIWGHMLISLGYYGWALPVSLGVEDGKLATALYMVSSSAGFAIPYYSTKDSPVTNAAASLSVYGGTRGIAHGITAAYLFDNPSHEAVIGAGMLVSIAEAFAGFHIAGNSNMSTGKAEVIGVGGDFGLGFGLGAAHLADLFEDNGQSTALVTLLGTGVGLLGGNMLANRQHYTGGDAYVLSAVGLLGGYIPLAFVDIAGPEDERVYTAASMLGAVAGLGLGHKMLANKNFSTDQGNLVRLATLAGGLLGSGIAYLVTPEDDDNSTAYLIGSSLGAAGGFALLYGAYAPDAQQSHSNFLGNIQIAPQGLLALLSGGKNQKKERSTPLIMLNYRF